MSSHRLTWLDVFTDRPFTGNGLAVVHDADGVPDAAMLAFAGETRLSETSFLQAPEDPQATYRHRIWMVRYEVPFAGHPSLGAAAAYVRAAGQTSATVTQQTRAGLQPIDVEVAGDRARVSMLQEPMTAGPELDADEVLGLVGLSGEDADPDLGGVRIVATGVPQVLAFVRDDDAVRRARLADLDGIAALVDAHAALVLYVVHVDGERALARSFFPGGEDPATGAAAGPVCAHVHARGGTARLTISQGEAIGRPSTLLAEMEGDRPRVGGDVVVVMDGQVRLDA